MFKIRVFLSLAVFSFGVISAEIIEVKEPSTLPNDPAELYIDLMKKCVANTIYRDGGLNTLVGRHTDYDAYVREEGRDWPDVAHTMIGKKRLDNIHACLKTIIEEGVLGDCIETGVWRGGATILMRAILKAYNDNTRKVWVADSFAGPPPPNPSKYPADTDLNLYQYTQLVVSLRQVKDNFSRYGLLDDQVVFLKGLFANTLPSAPIESLALLRLDGDLYESTMDALVNLYPKLSPGGFIIIDDYGDIPACAKAVSDYRDWNGIKEEIIVIDRGGVYWRKR